MNKNDSMSLEQSSFNTKHNNLADLLDIKNLKLLSEDKINSFRSGYESNNYLILSVTSDNLESFKYLLKEKNMSLLIKNSNGWNAFHFIIKHKRISINFINYKSFYHFCSVLLKKGIRTCMMYALRKLIHLMI